MNDKKQVVDTETANAEFERFADGMDIDIDTSNMDVEDKTAFEKLQRRFINAIEQGHLVINENDEAVYTPHRKATKIKEPITFHERSGANTMAMDRSKKGQEVRKGYALMAEMCNIHPNIISGLVGTDLKICEGIFGLLTD